MNGQIRPDDAEFFECREAIISVVEAWAERRHRMLIHQASGLEMRPYLSMLDASLITTLTDITSLIKKEKNHDSPHHHSLPHM